MIDLNKHTAEIKKFLNTSIERFQTENGKPNSIGIYSCSWAGWISINFNVNKSLTETANNCPDFEYVEFDLLEIPELQDEYETDNPEFKINDSIKTHDHELGDENFNQLIFEYLKPIVKEIKGNFESDFLLQMLDSNLAEEI
ncbi:hypothetical protein D778_00176 [Xanthomarina gelatinilytica]|uniref:DUF4303 domain-containing protein n=1 Tax=Xanthomarina gelatinilytica TaxID=1137281 RepID=M7MIR9_9FLAO|nr:hypothetical protein [Xanthomarina gelatinilytica]EMQ94991.1 hypothetical protein D778_00176 [Xanthomarina gelatinilytica]